ncbi:MOSC domain protein [Maioricimonas rarisocia]|uniref:MOSC domain protein n=1 Tax=Maioricimonas rarisocia TaxID=2528026 RepID=A0A517ZBY8_9PLAN|nr:MOSC domain-containing protein [Maioricimonas rarisocia]QDU39998.1 MOSC domain protein [Maioricimonas rarisocia]
MKELMNHQPHTGRLEWIGLSSTRRAEVTSVESAKVEVGTGLDGDHHATSGKGSKRQVTLIQQEHLPVIAALCRLDDVSPAKVRRNLVVSGINLASLKNKRFRIGEVLLEGTGYCHPCSLMEEVLGDGGYNAMRGHGGITTIVVEPGTIRVGDPVQFVSDGESADDDDNE